MTRDFVSPRNRRRGRATETCNEPVLQRELLIAVRPLLADRGQSERRRQCQSTNQCAAQETHKTSRKRDRSTPTRQIFGFLGTDQHAEYTAIIEATSDLSPCTAFGLLTPIHGQQSI
jgi:hypothetical protein